MSFNECKRSGPEGDASFPSSGSKRQRGLHPKTGEYEEQLLLEPISSVTDSLSVPLSIIFREVPQVSLMTMTATAAAGESVASSQQQQRRNKPLLSRAEAQAFLTVTLLAQEVDSLVSLSAAALQQQYTYESFRKQLQHVDNPYLRPLLPALHVMSQQIPNTALQHVQIQLHRVVAELQTVSISLRQFSEQNWTLSESLMDAGSGFVLADEKKRLSDVQDETCTRIDALLLLLPPLQTTFAANTTTTTMTTSSAGKDAHGDTTSNRVGSAGYETMKEYCEKIFPCKDLSDQPALAKEGGVEGMPSLSANRQQSEDGREVDSSPMSVDSPKPSVQKSVSTPQVQQPVSSTSPRQHSLPSATNRLSKSPPAEQSSVSMQDSSQPQQAPTAATTTTTPRASPSIQVASSSLHHKSHSSRSEIKLPHSEERHLSSLTAPEFSSTPAQQQASLSAPDSLVVQRSSFSMADDSASQQQQQQEQEQISSTTTFKQQASSQEKENVSSQEHQGAAYDLIYGGGSQGGSSQGSFTESQNCRLGSATQSAAEVLSALAATASKTPRMASSPK